MSLFFCIILKHTHAFLQLGWSLQNSVTVEIGLLHWKPLTNNNFHFLITVEMAVT